MEHTTRFKALLSVTLGVVWALVAAWYVWMWWGWQHPVQVSNTTGTVESSLQSIVVNYSSNVSVASDYEAKLRTLNDREFAVAWSNAHTLVLTPATPWQVGESETVLLPEVRTKWWYRVPETRVAVATPALPAITSQSVQSGATDVLLDAESPIEFTFAEPLGSIYVDINITPATDAAYQISEDGRTLKVLPKVWAPGTAYTFDLAYRFRSDMTATLTPLTSISFTTVKPRVTAPKVLVAAPTTPQVVEGKYIDINLAKQRMTLFENGEQIAQYSISSGKRGMETPKGVTKIYNKSPRPWSKKYSLYMPNWMAISPDGAYGIHELPEWPSGYKEGANHLGIPVSHGCVRLGVGPSDMVYAWTDIGTKVIVY